MFKILHNTRCRKSREALKFLLDKKIDFKIREYLKNPPDIKELNFIIKVLNIKPIHLVRKNEDIWKSNYKQKYLSNKFNDKDLIYILCKNPKLIERPIVIFKNKAVIARPYEKINELF